MIELRDVQPAPASGRRIGTELVGNVGDRLVKETLVDVALKVEQIGPDEWKVSGRGLLHLGILLENMRREGYELQVSKPEMITRKIDGVLMEPVEIAMVDVPNEYDP